MIEEMFKEQQGALGTLEPMGWGPYSLVSLVYDRTNSVLGYSVKFLQEKV